MCDDLGIGGNGAFESHYYTLESLFHLENVHFHFFSFFFCHVPLLYLFCVKFLTLYIDLEF